MRHRQSFRKVFLMAGILLFLMGFKVTYAQTFTPLGGGTVEICGVPKFPALSGIAPNGCYTVQNSQSMAISQAMMMAQIADLKDQLVALNQAVTALRQSNEEAARASQAAVAAIQKENSQFNQDFSAAMVAKLNNYPADFVKSPAYQQLKKELTDMINQRLGPPPTPTTGPSAPAPPTSTAVPPSQQSKSSKK
jgi:hypothetical protein